MTRGPSHMYILCYIICFSTISKILNKTEWFILCWDMLIDAAGKGWIPSQWRIFLQPKPAPITLSDAEAWLNSFIRKAAWVSSPPHHHTTEQIRGKLWRAVHSLTSDAGAWLVAAGDQSTRVGLQAPAPWWQEGLQEPKHRSSSCTEIASSSPCLFLLAEMAFQGILYK